MMQRRSKFSRGRGCKTHGWGAKKKHRGTGNYGGKGNAGSGKRCQSRKPSVWKDVHFMGRFGFKTKNKILRTITLRDLDKQNKEGKIDLTSAGYDKLLGSGSINKKFEITVQFYTKKAVEKVKAKGGSIIGTEIKEEQKEPVKNAKDK